MKSTLIDSNVLIDLFDGESPWQSWSDSMIAASIRPANWPASPIVIRKNQPSVSGAEFTNDGSASSACSMITRRVAPVAISCAICW